MIEDINKLQQEFEGRFFQAQAEVEEKALAMYKEDPAKAAAFLTDYTCGNMFMVEKAWWDLGWHLVGKYQDGYVMNEEGQQKQVGYPTEWLKEVGFGETMIQK